MKPVEYKVLLYTGRDGWPRVRVTRDGKHGAPTRQNLSELVKLLNDAAARCEPEPLTKNSKRRST